MGQSKHEYFHKGADNQIRPDIVIDLKRPAPEKMGKWTDAERASLPDFIATCEQVFAAFVSELKNQCNVEK